MFNYSSEELWKLYRNLPKELKEASWSIKNAEKISRVCQRHGLTKEQEKQVMKIVTYVFFGLIPPPEFTQILEKEIKIEKEITKKIYNEINAFIFFPVKDSLEKLYNIKIVRSKKEKEQSKKKDTYREIIE